MYLYLGDDSITGLSWFRTKGSSTYEVALMYQNGKIKDLVPFAYHEEVEVGFYNISGFEFSEGRHYHLEIRHQIIKSKFDEREYVDKWFRPDLSDIVTDQTWMKLFGKLVDRNKIIDDNEYDTVNNPHKSHSKIDTYEVTEETNVKLEDDIEELIEYDLPTNTFKNKYADI
jgi:hypothetical protein